MSALLNKPHIWRIRLRRLSFVPSERHEFSWLIATKSENEQEAAMVAKEQIHAPEWWQHYLLTGLEYLGPVMAAQPDALKEGE